jgi:hypothetical protein
MVAQQVLRHAVLTLTCGLAVGWGRGQAFGQAEPIVVVDLREGAEAERDAYRAAVTDALAHQPGLVVAADAELASALAGVRHDPSSAAARAHLAEARAAYGELDCARATPAALQAVAALAARQAAGASVVAELLQAYAYLLLCADSGGDRTGAYRAARWLHRLGHRPPHVPRAVWDRYPAYDAATNLDLVELTLRTEPAGGDLWLDHGHAGTAPITVSITAGEHVNAATPTDPNHDAAAMTLLVDPTTGPAVTLTLPAASQRFATLRRWVADWRRGAREPTPADLGALLATLAGPESPKTPPPARARARVGVRTAILLTQTSHKEERLEAWGLPLGATGAVLIGSAPTAGLSELAHLITLTTASWDRGEPQLPLASPVAAPAPAAKKPQPWWVYASVIGAVGLGAAIVLAKDLADDHQRIEVRWP